jgi:hypothetical protein
MSPRVKWEISSRAGLFTDGTLKPEFDRGFLNSVPFSVLQPERIRPLHFEMKPKEVYSLKPLNNPVTYLLMPINSAKQLGQTQTTSHVFARNTFFVVAPWFL